MTFTVYPDDVEGYVGALTDLAPQAQQAQQYLGDHLDIGFAQGRMFASVVATASEVRAELAPNYASLQRLTTDAAAELTKAVAFYRATDTTAATRLDAGY